MTIKFEVPFLFYMVIVVWSNRFQVPKILLLLYGYIAAMAYINVFHLIVLGLHCYMLVSHGEVHRVHLVTLGLQFCS